jgi:cathepsin L
MKAIFVCLLVIFVSFPIDASYEEAEWKNYKRKFRKSYESPEEEAKRFETFKENLKLIQEHNENKSMTWKLGVVQSFDIENENEEIGKSWKSKT